MLPRAQLVTSAKEVMFLMEFVCLLAGLHENYSTSFTTFGEKVAHTHTQREREREKERKKEIIRFR